MKRRVLLGLLLTACSSPTHPSMVQVSHLVSGVTLPETVKVNQSFNVTFTTSTWGEECGTAGGRTEVSVGGLRADITPLDSLLPGPSDCMGDDDDRSVSLMFSGVSQPSVATVVVHSTDSIRTAYTLVTP